MKIQDILNNVLPGGKEKTNLSLDEILDLCPTFVEAYKSTDKLLYRGIKSMSPDVFIGKPHQARVARDSSQEASDVFNTILKQHGIIARRDNSIFATSDLDQAKRYGHPYIILPLDPFEFTWSKKQKDIVLSKFHVASLFDKEKSILLYREVMENLPKNLIYDFLIPDDVLSEKHVGSVMGFLGINWDQHLETIQNATELPEHIRKMADPMNLISWNKIQNLYELKVDNFNSAVDSEHEIWIHGSYFAINYDMKDYFLKVIDKR